MTDSVPHGMERWLGISTASGEGAAWSLEWSWPWPAWLSVLILALIVAVVAATYARENRRARPAFRVALAAMRLVLVAIAAFMLAQPALSLKRTGLPYVALVVDDSLSMTIADRYPEGVRAAVQPRVAAAGFDRLTRWNLARTLLVENDAAFLRRLEENYRLKPYWLSGTRPSSASEAARASETMAAELRASEPSAGSTRLGAAIRSVLDELRGNAPAAVVLVTDGINTEGPSLADAAADARRRGVPLYFIGLGDDRPARDVKLSDLLVDDAVFLGDVVYFEAKLSSWGCAGRTVEVTLRQEGQEPPVARTRLKLGPDGQSQPARLAHRPPREGVFRYVLEVQPLEDEFPIDNNRVEATVRVRKERIRVLLVQAEPSYEYRYLRNLLVREPTVELATVLQDADPEHADQDAAALRSFPVRRDELFRYDVILLGDADPARLTPAMLRNLAEFVDQPGKGGALACLGGPKFMPLAFRDTPLAKLLPMELGSVRVPSAEASGEGFVVRPTELGLGSPMLQLADDPADNAAVWRSLAPLEWMLEIGELKPGARVLAEHPTRRMADGRPMPVFVLHYVGAGKVLFHATDETWRWRYRVGDAHFARYWLQTIRYLARSKLAEGARAAALRADRREYRQGDAVRLRARFYNESLAPAEDDGVTVVLESSGGGARRVPLRRAAGERGVFDAEVENLPIGSYHAWIAVPLLAGGAPAADFTVLAPPGEFARVETDALEMQRAADQSRGRYYTFAAADRLLEELPEGRQVPLEAFPPLPLWNAWPVLAAFLILLIAEWVLRKLGGMA